MSQPTTAVAAPRSAKAVARDFARPRRLAPARARAIVAALAGALPALERELSRSNGLAVALALVGDDGVPGAVPIGEADAGAFLASLAEPLAVLRFRCGKSPAWLVCEPRAAVAVVEALLGARDAAAEPRTLTPVEARVGSAFLAEIARGVASALGLAASDGALVQLASELGSWRDGGAGSEPYRLEVRLELGIELAPRRSERIVLRLYLPDAPIGAAPEVAPLPKALPARLERVEIELAATLAGCELSLDQLLALEEGDVIPLAARVDEPTALVVDGLTVARARLGSHRGRLAVRIEHLDVESERAA